MKTVTSNCQFRYAGVNRKKGDIFEMKEADVIAYVSLGMVTYFEEKSELIETEIKKGTETHARQILKPKKVK